MYLSLLGFIGEANPFKKGTWVPLDSQGFKGWPKGLSTEEPLQLKGFKGLGVGRKLS